MSDYSASRLESRIAETISTLIVSGKIKNPHLSRFASVTEVRLASDNTACEVFISTVREEDLDRSVAALNSAAGFIQSFIAKALKTRNTPKLEFIADRSYQEGERLGRLIDKAMGRDGQ